MEDHVRPLVDLIERRRKQSGTSVREAARTANLSEGRWRQIAKGYQSAGGLKIPVNTPDETLLRMALATGVSGPDAAAVGASSIAANLDREAEAHADPMARISAPLTGFSDSDLLHEIARRLDLGRGRDDVQVPPLSAASWKVAAYETPGFRKGSRVRDAQDAAAEAPDADTNV